MLRVRLRLPDGVDSPAMEYEAEESFSVNLYPVHVCDKERISLEEYTNQYEARREQSIEMFTEGKTKLQPMKPWDELTPERQNELYEICGFIEWNYCLLKRKAVHYPNGYYIKTDKWVWLTNRVEVIGEER